MNLEVSFTAVTCSDKALRYMQIASMVVEEGGEARTINLCKQCCNERLVQQGKQPLKSKEWRGDCGKGRLIVAGNGRSSEVNNLCAECGSISLSREYGQGRFQRTMLRKNKKEYKASGWKNLPSISHRTHVTRGPRPSACLS